MELKPFKIEVVPLEDDKCLRCGKCCVLADGKDCRYLVWEGDKSRCSVYADRLGKVTGGTETCIRRSESIFDYPDCPYNSGRMMHG